ncbi:chemotaxis protein [Sphingomonas sp. Leaf357]|nr:chemotaxis protein [Sphingomonas sp. Leaf357]
MAMLTALSIPRKLGLSFIAVSAAAAIMMLVFFTNISQIRESTEKNNLSQSIFAKALTLETSMLRQNSQFRGFLVTSDATYLKSYNEARDEYDKTSVELEGLLTDPARRALVVQSRSETLAWRKNWGDRLIERVRDGGREEAQAEVRAAGDKVLVSKVAIPLRELRATETKNIEDNSAQQDKAIATATIALIIGGLALIGLATGLAVVLSQAIARPITRLTKSMAELATGQHDLAVPDIVRRDELGDMARAVVVFQDAARGKQADDARKARSDAEQKLVVETLSDQLATLSTGDLTASISIDFPAEYASLKSNFNDALGNLRTLIAAVGESATTIHTGSNEIAEASEDLARRTESNAASLEQTAASVAQMDGRLRTSATAAAQTAERTDQALTIVSDGRDVADKAVQAMGRVSGSAKGIDAVIEGLDKIAFQTRVLAMNAAVEAGRAGEAGRGFAVVADLVSALAMRAEEEAKTARDQLTVTQADIVTAVDAVHKVDDALVTISDDVGEVHRLVARMASDNQAQSAAITEISAAIGTMDRSTQQNAAMVEQTSAAARNLVSEVGRLSQRSSQFIVSSGGRAAVKRAVHLSPPARSRAAELAC